MEKQKLTLTALDHLMPRGYATKLLYFPRTNPNITTIASKLEAGLKRTFETLPILSGTVRADEDGQPGQEGALCVDAPWMEVKDIFVVKDFTGCEDLVYADLKRNHFPMTTTERYNFRSVSFTDRGRLRTVPAPVMMAQVNFIRGGMVLAQCLHHSFMDGPGGVVIMRLWAAFCRGDDGGKLLTESMWDRTRLMPGDKCVGSGSFDGYIDCSRKSPPVLSAVASEDGQKQTAGESNGSRSPSALQADNGSEEQRMAEHKETKRKKEVDTEIFFISQDRLAALKAAISNALPRESPTSAPAASKTVPGEGFQVTSASPGQRNCGSVVDNVSRSDSISSQPYISTNDALIALLFTCIAAARSSTSGLHSSSIPRSYAPNDSTRPHPLPHTLPLGLSVNGRRLLSPPLPETYIGNTSVFCHLNIPLSHLSPLTKSTHTTPTSALRTIPQADSAHQPTAPSSTPAIAPDVPTMASVASRIRARLLELDEKYVRGLIGALSRVDDLAKVQPACRVSGIRDGTGTRILGQRQDVDNDSPSARAAGALAGGSKGGEVTSPPSWDFMITPWTTQGFYAMDWGVELLGGSANDGEHAHDEDEGVGRGGGGVRMGRCERVRIPKVRWETLDGVIVVLPMLEGKGEKGGLEVMIGLERGVMERLKGMEEWCKWAVPRCS